jgi:hypothetical protein
MIKRFGLIVLSALILAGGVHAQAATEGASQLRDSVKQKVAEELAQIKKAVAKKAFVGSIATKSEVAITMTTLGTNQSRTVNVTTDTVIKLTSGKEGTPADLKVGDFILVMGDVDSQNTMTAKRLLVVGKPAVDNRKATFGTVSKTAASSFTITTPNGDTWTVKISSSTRYTKKSKASDFVPGSTLVVTGTVSDTAKTITASRIHLISAPTAVSSTTTPAAAKPTSNP